MNQCENAMPRWSRPCLVRTPLLGLRSTSRHAFHRGARHATEPPGIRSRHHPTHVHGTTRHATAPAGTGRHTFTARPARNGTSRHTFTGPADMRSRHQPAYVHGTTGMRSRHHLTYSGAARHTFTAPPACNGTTRHTAAPPDTRSRHQPTCVHGTTRHTKENQCLLPPLASRR